MTSQPATNKIIALTREVAPSIVDCELTYLEKQPIDYAKACREHEAYCEALRELGLEVVTLPHGSFADGVFVEDPAIVVDELALINHMGAESRRKEAESLAQALSRYRKLIWMAAPATLDGGDVLKVGRTLYVGISQRTNSEGVAELKRTLEPLGYRVVSSKATGCLHFKSGCSYLGLAAGATRETILINPEWIPRTTFAEFDLLEIDPSEPHSANALRVGDTVICSAAFPKTAERMRKAGFKLKTLDNTELLKAESGVTCSSQIFTDSRPL